MVTRNWQKSGPRILLQVCEKRSIENRDATSTRYRAIPCVRVFDVLILRKSLRAFCHPSGVKCQIKSARQVSFFGKPGDPEVSDS